MGAQEVKDTIGKNIKNIISDIEFESFHQLCHKITDVKMCPGTQSGGPPLGNLAAPVDLEETASLNLGHSL